MHRQYPALIHKEPGSDYGVSFPDLPGCVSAGTTLEEAHEMGAEALQGHLEVMLEAGDPIPAPSALEDVYELARQDSDVVGVAILRARLPGAAKRINITLDEFLLKDIDHHAEALGTTRSAYLAEAARRLMAAGR
jgi:predicted RNase H-like HicB family nuclease